MVACRIAHLKKKSMFKGMYGIKSPGADNYYDADPIAMLVNTNVKKYSQ